MVVHQPDGIQSYPLLQLWLTFIDMNLGFYISLFKSLFFLWSKVTTLV